jgi:hypothetical protein
VSSKIAEKRKKHSEVMIKLQKEELNARKKADKERKKLQDNYEIALECDVCDIMEMDDTKRG